MKEIVIGKNQADQRFDKFLKKYLPNTTSGFIYKMLRKKNITLNDKKADGTEILKLNDSVKLFFSDETFVKFTENNNKSLSISSSKNIKNNSIIKKIDIEKITVYEDNDIIIVNKPVGILSQKAQPDDISINEIIIDYLLSNKKIGFDDLTGFTPSVCNRLDRNTSGLITFGKTLKGTKMLSSMFKERSVEKYYVAIVKGKVTQREIVHGYLNKNKNTNKVSVSDIQLSTDDDFIKTEYIPFEYNSNISFIKIRLYTGKTHQIRAHLASLGHPLIGDYKYGYKPLNELIKKKYNINYQMLHAYEMHIDGKKPIYADIPETMINILKDEGLWEPGKQGDLEALH